MTDCTPHPRPPSSRKKRKLSKAETDAMILWKTLDVPVGCDPHHIIYAQKLRQRGHSDKLWDLRNRLVVTREEHERHHAGFALISRERLPESVWRFALELDGGDLYGYFTEGLYRNYPLREGGVKC